VLSENEPFSRREAWLWLLSEAAWKPHKRRIIGRTIELARGQYAGSVRFIGTKWRWNEARVRRFLRALISSEMIDAKTDAGVTVITVCKYDEYQRVSLPADSTPETDVVAAATQERRKVEDKEDKEYSEANASGAEAPRDVRSELFNRGLTTLGRLTGKGPDACRSFVGKCLKAASDDAVTVLGLIEDADRNRVVDPSAWISARLKSTGPPGRPLTEFQRGKQELKGILDDLDRAGSKGCEANPRLLPGNSGERSQGIRGGAGGDVIDLPASGYRSSG
jgi:hypothetical protein